MDTGNHFYTAALPAYAMGCSAEQVIMAGAIAASPDIIGAYGNYVKKDNQKLYLIAHSDGCGIMALLFGGIFAILGSVLGISMLTSIAIGLYGYVVHLFLDTQTHTIGKRWWLWMERAFWNYSAWVILCVAALFANPIHPWFALMGGIWASLVCSYCYVFLEESK